MGGQGVCPIMEVSLIQSVLITEVPLYICVYITYIAQPADQEALIEN